MEQDHIFTHFVNGTQPIEKNTKNTENIYSLKLL